jgi:hypothetical protein
LSELDSLSELPGASSNDSELVEDSDAPLPPKHAVAEPNKHAANKQIDKSLNLFFIFFLPEWQLKKPTIFSIITIIQ